MRSKTQKSTVGQWQAYAPANSMIDPRIKACQSLIERDETDVAQELAASLAPIFQASRKANIVPMAKM